MKHDVQQENELRRYLLGELPLEEQVLVEQRLFLDSDYAELQEVVEDDLIDEYLADELKGNERKKFEDHFLLLPEHSADVKIAEALKKYLATESNPSRAGSNDKSGDDPTPVPFWLFSKQMVWLSLSVAALILLSIMLWIVFRSARGPAAEPPLQASEPQRHTSQPDNSPVPTPVPSNDNRNDMARQDNSVKPPERRSAPTQILSYVIFAGGAIRSGGTTKTINIDADTKAVELKLPLEFVEPYEQYRAELYSGDRRIKRWDLKSQTDETYGPIVLIPIPADLLREHSYRIKLYTVPTDQQAGEPSVPYPFNVERNER